LKLLGDSVARRDSDAVYRVAHTLEGSAAMVGAATLAHSAGRLGVAARREAFDECEPLVAELSATFDAITRVVQAGPDRV
jgi:HPt (histidine-containing phosphotransfer) domain-containing protein